MSYAEHQSESRERVARCAVVTLSDTRTEATDRSGTRIRELLDSHGHTCVAYHLIPDDPQQLDALLAKLAGRAEIDVILTDGGTGISSRDTTIEVAERQLERVIPGFGELFRMLSFEQIGSGAMLSRAIAGTIAGKLLFCMPGSTPAVEMAMTRLILPELRHLLGELRKQGGAP